MLCIFQTLYKTTVRELKEEIEELKKKLSEGDSDNSNLRDERCIYNLYSGDISTKLIMKTLDLFGRTAQIQNGLLFLFLVDYLYLKSFLRMLK